MKWKTCAVVIVAASIFVAGCSNGDDSSSSDTSGATDQGAEEFSFGQPASSSGRIVEIEARDDFSFDPATVEVTAGEVVTFSVTNVGKLDHEFTLGDEAVQDEHEAEMVEMGDMEMDDEPNAISVAPGETAELSWEFASAGTVLFACHTAGHWDAGMRGEIAIS